MLCFRRATYTIFSIYILGMYMNNPTYTRTLLRSCFFAVLCMMLSATTMSSFSYAAECDEGNCRGIKIANSTGYDLEIRFLLCCDGETRRTDCYEVPPGRTLIEFPDGCTLLRWGFCNTLSPKICYTWYPDECVLRIYECP